MPKVNESKKGSKKGSKKVTGVSPNITKKRKPQTQTRDDELVSIVHEQYGYDLKAAAALVLAIRDNENRRMTGH